MPIFYSHILSLLFLLLITHWSHTASLHSDFYSLQNSSIVDTDTYNQVPLIRRLRRWSKIGDNDEVEIPVTEAISSVDESTDVILSNSSTNNTLFNFETIELNSSTIQNFVDLINSTISMEFNMTLSEIHSDDNTTMNNSLLRLDLSELNQTTISIQEDDNTTIKYPLLRQDLTELNQTDVPTTEKVLQDNKTDVDDSTIASTDSQTLVTYAIHLNQAIQNDKNESITNQTDSVPDEVQVTSASTILNQTVDQVELVTASIHSVNTSVFSNTTENDHTNGWDFLLNDRTETISYNDSLDVTTGAWNMSQKDAMIYEQEFHTNDTDVVVDENDQNSNETVNFSSKSQIIPVCDHECQCSKECPYGFELINDTCQCDPPCKNYQCFGNDTCTVTDKGQALCQPENGTQHDRPIRCYQPRDAGYHDSNLRYYNRWYYHPDQDTCHLFVYRGLGGNENNFETLQECHLECITCAPSPDRGECFGQFNMWYYNNKKNECAQFEYSGCKGNENKFLKKEECIDTCVNRTLFL